MPSPKVVVACVLAALGLAACGTKAKPVAGSVQATTTSHKQVADPRKTHVKCLRKDRIPLRLENLNGYPSIQVGTRPSGPTIEFRATPGAAQAQQIQGRAQGAEVIGAALVYPNRASDKLMGSVENCVAKGVSG